VSLEKRLILTLNALLRLVAIRVPGTAITCQLEDSEHEPIPVPSVVLVRQWLVGDKGAA